MMVEAKVGDWLIIRSWEISVRQITKITPKLYKLGDGTQRYPTQIGREERKVLGHVQTREAAEIVAQTVRGIDGEFRRRQSEADKDRSDRVRAAKEVRDAAIAKVFASAQS